MKMEKTESNLLSAQHAFDLGVVPVALIIIKC